ncbi:MAG: TolC family protein [Spartobacteria bacterium]|nr:TolC family protein [Spartobacteria bacterium]
MRTKVCVLLLAIFWAFPSWAEDLLTMGQAVEVGLRSNPSLAAVRESLLGADYAIKASKAAFGPSLSTSYGYTRLDERPQSWGMVAGTLDNWQLSFNVNQPLFTGFQLLTAHQKALLQKEQLQSQLRNAELQLTLAIQEAFLGLLQARESVKSAEDSHARLREHLKVNNAFYAVGLRPKLDVLQAQVDVATAEQNLVSARNAVQTRIAHLNSLLGRNVDAPTVYDGNLEYRPMLLASEDCQHRAESNRPDLILAQQAVQLAEKDVSMAKVPYYPQVAADFNYVREGEDPMVHGGNYHVPSDWNAQVGMKWKFFEWGKTYYEQKQAEKGVSRLEQEYLNLRNQAAFEVKQYYLAIKDAEERISAAKQALTAAKESLRMATARYEAQVGTNSDVLDALAAQTQSEANLTNALADYEVAVARLYVAMGVRNPALLSQ